MVLQFPDKPDRFWQSMNPMPNVDSLPLRDIHLPDPVGWWPPAVGWWAALVLALLVLTGLIVGIRRWRQVAPVAAALRELAQLEADDIMTAREKLQTLSRLMKRVALSLHSRETVAGLTGDQWLRWLDETGGSTCFSQGAGRSLVEAPFRSEANDEEVAGLIRLCRDWLHALGKRGKARNRARRPFQADTAP